MSSQRMSMRDVDKPYTFNSYASEIRMNALHFYISASIHVPFFGEF